MEAEVIELFVQFSRALGQPRSVAEIYGLLFVSHLPLTLQDLKERLTSASAQLARDCNFYGSWGRCGSWKLQIPGAHILPL